MDIETASALEIYKHNDVYLLRALINMHHVKTDYMNNPLLNLLLIISFLIFINIGMDDFNSWKFVCSLLAFLGFAALKYWDYSLTANKIHRNK